MLGLSKFFGKNNTDKRDQEISSILPLSSCNAECESCPTKFPSGLKIDEDSDIYNSAKPTDVHFIIPTSKTDWAHDATSTPNTVENAIVAWKDKYGDDIIKDGNFKVSTSSLPFDSVDPRCYKSEVNDVLILPFFVWLRKIEYQNVDQVLNKLIPLLIKLRDEGSELPKKIDNYRLFPAIEQAFIFLCSHRTRDKRCGITAPLMKKEMDAHLRDLELYRDVCDDRPNGINVSFINHVGGHKFAANVIIYMKTGEIIWLARCNPANAKPIIDETVLGGGKVWGDLVRVVQKTKSVEW
ncbi:hypothetical protein WICANDRAFT_35995 [Wickerhamomyces anomalus NRRL Y-366-8]|uniref:Actin patches distal protein 1 n=1 Tax=Wickerhamomyces anomalus (strain ATCC 58044 / CBS 1984 / NCYC 433 / NRRL Y-366-8) TaxID=683960 RepID=A0A1E3NV97_WICAA|nr:uncharacterized protein WICANDRAFT_35995 [Wickerhamomyces anomalus NRRL Y-366-8]ODQ57025.1 hypothetical protein WICANDRAFT_35995 [Wickerhamomyces anomalus NRRL Y-366-8]